MVRELLRPATVSEAVRMASRPRSAFLGGGTSLNSGLGDGPEVLISLERLGLDVLVRLPDRLRIGATVTLQQIVDSGEVPKPLREAAALTASRTIRCMATVGGELALRPADSALIPLLVVMGAEARLASRKRPVPVEELCQGPWRDLLLEIAVPLAAPEERCGVRALSRTSHGPRSLVVAVDRVGPRILASDCRGQLFRFVELEEELAGAPLPARGKIEEAVARVFFPTPDPWASAEYKRHIAGILVADLLLGERGARP
jgi:putative selenate reductase FAD-binding subunit